MRGRHEKPTQEVNWRQTFVNFLVSFLSGLLLWLIDKIVTK